MRNGNYFNGPLLSFKEILNVLIKICQQLDIWTFKTDTENCQWKLILSTHKCAILINQLYKKI